jgi:hypothetical protein
MGRLAFVAVLLLALLPTVGRIAQAQAPAGHEVAPTWAALCTVQGLRTVLLPASPHESPSPAPTPGPHAGADCEYCPLLAGTVAPVVGSISVPPPALSPALCTSPDSVTRTQPHPCGLGSRGPPLVS